MSGTLHLEPGDFSVPGLFASLAGWERERGRRLRLRRARRARINRRGWA